MKYLCIITFKLDKDYSNFKTLPKILNDSNYRMNRGYVLSNEREIKKEGKIIYCPIYFVMFL